MPGARKQCDGVLKKIHCPRLRSSVAACGRSSTAQCSSAVWRCIEGVPLATAVEQCGGVQKESSFPLLHKGVALYRWSPSGLCHMAVI